MNRVHLLAKPGPDGGRSKAARAAAEAARDFGFETVELRPPSSDRIAPTIVGAEDIERLVLVGGDGLIHQALPALVSTGVDVGVVPAGTGNDLARGLGLLAGSERDRYRRAFTAPTAPVDVMSDGSTDRLAISVVTAGFSGEVNRLANDMDFPRGSARYTVATLRTLPGLEAIETTIRTEDGTIERPLSFFAVGNTSSFGGGMDICPDADPTDGMLDITLVDDVSALALLTVLPLVFAGQHVRHPAVTTVRSPWIEIETSAALWADGEPFGQAPIRIEVGSDHRVMLAR